MRKLVFVVIALAGMVSFAGHFAAGQANGDANAERARRAAFCNPATAETVHTYYLANVSQPNDGNEIQTALRNLLPPEGAKLYFVPSQSALMVCGAPEQQALVVKVIHDLDRPRKGYRISYTITELDAGKRVGTQHYSLIAANGQRTVVKQGSKVPIATGVFNPGSSTSAAGAQTQYQYLDVGMNFDVTFTETAGGGLLKSKVEESSVAETTAIAGVQEPVIRQSVFEGSPMVVLGRPAMLSSLDIPNSTRHVDVEVMVEEVR